MKEIILLTFLSSYILSFFPAKTVDFRPPGTVKIVDNFFVDETEITNISWKEYVASLKEIYGKKSAVYLNALPDTTVWRLKDGRANVPFVNTYFQHPAYDDYPVVGISYDQAVAYCLWRTDVVNEMLERVSNKRVKIKYRLPSRTEWELIASAGYTDKQKKPLNKQNKKYNGAARNCNMKFEDSIESGFTMLAPARTYLPNKFLVYNIYGNVAEMVEEPNIAMGGSFLDYYHEIVPSHKTLAYKGPQNWLGFRAVCELI